MKLIAPSRFKYRSTNDGKTIWIRIFPQISIVIHKIYDDETGIEIQFAWLTFMFGWLFRIPRHQK